MKPHRIAFIRPQLGIGGAQRLVIDAMSALRSAGHDVRLFAPARLAEPEFDEARAPEFPRDSSYGFVPSQCLGRFRLPLAYLRGRLALKAARRFNPHVVILDSLPHLAPRARAVTAAKVVVYCHYPDSLLTPVGARERWFYRLYREPWDALEREGLRSADLRLANSVFTMKALDAFAPGLSVSLLRPSVRAGEVNRRSAERFRLLSVARFDPRKNLAVAIEALDRLRRSVDAETFAAVHLTLAGHVDHALPESAALVRDLRRLTVRLGLEAHVELILSPSPLVLAELMARCFAVIYTPREEHFGIVPLEAMAASRPVVAVNSGGPAQTIDDGKTGILVDGTAEGFAAALRNLIQDPARQQAMGEAGRQRVESAHSFDAFSRDLCRYLEDLFQDDR